MEATYKTFIEKNYEAAILPKSKLIDGKSLYKRQYGCLSLKIFWLIAFATNADFIDDAHKVRQVSEYLQRHYGYARGTINKYALFSKGGTEGTISRRSWKQDSLCCYRA